MEPISTMPEAATKKKEPKKKTASTGPKPVTGIVLMPGAHVKSSVPSNTEKVEGFDVTEEVTLKCEGIEGGYAGHIKFVLQEDYLDSKSGDTLYVRQQPDAFKFSQA